MSTGQGDSGSDAAAIRRAYEAIAAEIERLPDAALAFDQATELRNELDQLVGAAAELRARMAGRVWEAEELSLAALANRIGVSKGRADQFIRAAKAAKAAKRAEEDH